MEKQIAEESAQGTLKDNILLRWKELCNAIRQHYSRSPDILCETQFARYPLKAIGTSLFWVEMKESQKRDALFRTRKMLELLRLGTIQHTDILVYCPSTEKEIKQEIQTYSNAETEAICSKYYRLLDQDACLLAAFSKSIYFYVFQSHFGSYWIEAGYEQVKTGARPWGTPGLRFYLLGTAVRHGKRRRIVFRPNPKNTLPPPGEEDENGMK